MAVAWAGFAVWAAVPARAQEDGRPVYFVRDVAPIFDREGCSGGACHGKFGGGQGRLALSLMTLAPTTDFAVLEPLVDLKNPEQSLLLKKPTKQVEHGGGRRFKIGSGEYQTLLQWIQQGCRNPKREALPVALEVRPERFVFGPDNASGRIQVFCRFADDSVEDVTERTRFISRDEDKVTVSPKGYVTAERWGVTAVICRYVGLVKPVVVSLPRPSAEGDPPPPKAETGNIIDALVVKNLQWLNLNPAPTCDDYAFLRRISLDLVGALPTPEEIRGFVGDKDPKKREKLVDRLLADERFVALRTLRLGDMLRVNPRKLANGPLEQRAALVFDDWLRAAVASNEPYDRFAKELLGADGSPMLNGPANFYRVETTPQDRAETVAQAFLGIRLACARCHNHPFDRWKTDDYWQFSAFMAKVRDRGGELYGERVIYHDDDATLRNQSVTSENKGKVAVPTFLGGPSLPKEQFTGSYVQALADWITGPDNPYFAKATVNRVWSHLMGRGIIEPVDDIRETSVAAVPALLQLLADQFRRDGCDVRRLVRTIVLSKTYQMASDSDATNRLDNQFFSHYQPKQILPQVLLDAINTACGTVDRYGNYPLGTTSVALPLFMRGGSPALDFLDKFGRSDRQFLATLDPHVEPTLPQTLHMINSAFINQKLAAPGGVVAKLIKSVPDDGQVVEELYLRTLSRPPSEAERAKVLAYLKAADDRREAVEDLLWALISSREFLFVT